MTNQHVASARSGISLVYRDVTHHASCVNHEGDANAILSPILRTHNFVDSASLRIYRAVLWMVSAALSLPVDHWCPVRVFAECRAAIGS